MPSATAGLLEAQLERTLASTDLKGLGQKIEGKVRDSYLPGDGRRILVTTDRISAFDVVLGTIPFKGQILNQLSAYWFEETASVAPSHVISVPDPNVTIGRECTVFGAEFIVRAYLTGVTSTSIWTAYARGERTFAGHTLPEGLRRHEALPRPILTPSTKAPKGGHDETVAKDALFERGVLTPEVYDRAEAMCLALFAAGQRRAAERGLILADTKYELGTDADGRLVVVDEIHTPDSSRYWHADDYAARLSRGEEPRGLDKEYVRTWLKAQGYAGHGPPPPLPADVRVEAATRYIATYELVTGRTFVPDTSPPAARIARNLGARP